MLRWQGFQHFYHEKLDYIAKLETIIDDGIRKSTYIEATENTLKEQSRFQDILRKNFYNHKRYKDMKPQSCTKYLRQTPSFHMK